MGALDLQSTRPVMESVLQGKHGQSWTHKHPHLETFPLWITDHGMRHGHLTRLMAFPSPFCRVNTTPNASELASDTPRHNMSSSETTQILFNSPALHSLKRDQLVKLCKIHSIKASGKNTELIQKLQDHAATLPHASPLSVATRSEQHQDDSGSVSYRLDSQRPSEQWEVVMEDIAELPEGSSRGEVSSLRSDSRNPPDEFGTGGGSKCECFILRCPKIVAIFDPRPLLFSLQCDLLA